MCCTEAITRLLVFVANLAFLLVGGALLTLGIIYTVNYTHYTEAIPEQYQSIQYVPHIAIIMGIIIFFIAFLGCCGTLRSSTFMLTTYAGILFLIFLLQIGLGVYGLVQIKDTNDLENKLDVQMTKLFGRYHENKEINGVIDLIQQNLKCCGSTSALSWIWSHFTIPKSCYSHDESKELFGEGCSKAMYNFIMKSVKVIAVVALAISVTEIVGAVLALCLSNCIRASARKSAYVY